MVAEEFGDVRRNISIFLQSLRHSIDRPFRNRAPAEEERERFTRTLMMVEEARIRFSIYTRYREEPTKDQWHTARDELLSFIEAFSHFGLTDPAAYDRPFTIAPLMSGQRGNPTPFVSILLDRENRETVSEALVRFRDYLQGAEIGLAETQASLSLQDLGRIVPRQQVAPVKFDIVEGRIIISNGAPKTAKTDRVNIQSALEHIRGSGEQLLNNLEKSNCDRRLLESVTALHSQLVSEQNIVKIGLTNLACGVMGAQFQTELPDAIAGMLNAYNASISLYVAQFPEWEQFSQKAVLLDLDDDDVAEVDMVAGEVIEALTNNTSLADPEVPKTIAFVRQFLAFPGVSSRRAAFAMIRTIENLVSSIIRHSLTFFTKTAENLVDEGAKAATKVIIGLLGIAFVGASGIGPAAMRAGAPWVKQAAEIVQKQIEKAAE